MNSVNNFNICVDFWLNKRSISLLIISNSLCGVNGDDARCVCEDDEERLNVDSRSDDFNEDVNGN